MVNSLQTTKRNYGIDLLRIISMIFVICHHILMQGGLINASEPCSPKYYWFSFLDILAYCAVDCYALITGYVMCNKKFKLSNLLNLWTTVIFWSVVVSCVFFVIKSETRSVSEMVSMFLPVLRGRYWFFTAYVVMYFMTPVLNHIINTLNRNTYLLFFGACFIVFGLIPVFSLGYDVLRISNGLHFSLLIMMYLIGGYIKKYEAESVRLNCKKRNYLIGYFIIAGVHLIYKIAIEQLTQFVLGQASYGDLLLTYVSPFIIGEAVCLFLYFKQVNINAEKISGKLIKCITPCVFSVYIIHVHPLIFWNVMPELFASWAKYNPFIVTAMLVLLAMLVFIVCILLDKCRVLLFKALRISKLTDSFASRCMKTAYKIIGYL